MEKNSYNSFKPDVSLEIIEKIRLGEKLSPTLFSDVAEQAARACLDGKKNKSSQVRHFYDELVMWDEKINTVTPEVKNKLFDDSVPYIWMISAKLAYAVGRQLITPEFQKIFDHLIKQIRDPQTLKQAKTFFEAYLGFAKALEN